MSIFRVFVDDRLFYHPQLSQLAITKAQVQEGVENIDSLTLSAPFNHPYLSIIKPMASTIVCKKGDRTVFEGRALDEGSDLYKGKQVPEQVSVLRADRLLGVRQHLQTAHPLLHPPEIHCMVLFQAH